MIVNPNGNKIVNGKVDSRHNNTYNKHYVKIVTVKLVQMYIYNCYNDGKV